MVGSSLAGGVGAVGLIAAELRKLRVRAAEGSIHFVRRDLQETKRFPRLCRQRRHMRTRSLKQPEGADNVGLNERSRPMDGTIHMGFGSKIDHRARLMPVKEFCQQGCIGDVPLDKHVPGIRGNGLQVLQIAGVGQLVEVDDRLGRVRQPVEYKVAANEACAAGYQYGHLNGGRQGDLSLGM